jgi:hypothetical protein
MKPELLISGRTGKASFRIPTQWVSESVRDEIELLAYLPGPADEFAPNVVVTALPFDGTLDDFALHALEGLTGKLLQPYIVDVQLWDVPGRVIHYTHQSPENQLRLRTCEFLTIQNGLALQVSTTSTTSQWPLFSELFEQIARSTRPMEVSA